MLQLRNEQSRLGELAEHYEELLSDVGPLPAWRAALAWSHVQGGRPDAARGVLESLRGDGIAAMPRDANYLPALAILAHIAGELRDAELTAEVEPLLRPYTDLWVVLGPGPATLGPVAYSVGLANLVAGNHERAAQYFVVATEKSSAMHAWPYLARSHAGMAEALRARGTSSDVERAADLDEQALSVARELEMTRLLAESGAVAPS